MLKVFNIFKWIRVKSEPLLLQSPPLPLHFLMVLPGRLNHSTIPFFPLRQLMDFLLCINGKHYSSCSNSAFFQFKRERAKRGRNQINLTLKQEPISITFILPKVFRYINLNVFLNWNEMRLYVINFVMKKTHFTSH